MEQLNVGTNELPSVAKKKVIAVSWSSTEAFPTAGLALQLVVPTAAATSIPGRKMGEECWNSVLDGRLEAVTASIQLEEVVAATSEAARLWETLPTTSWVLGPYEKPVT
jgi:energy-converting hydrogenase Eha subunit A